METTKSPGQVAFEAYNESKGGLTYDGKPIPPWSSLEGETGLAVRRAWEVAANATIDALMARFAANPGTLIDRARRYIEMGVPRGREQALVLTKLDEAAMWFGAIPYESPQPCTDPVSPGVPAVG